VVWIFALGIIALMVFHRGFRKVMFWLGGIGGVIVAVYVAVLLVEDHDRKGKEAADEAAKKAAWHQQHPKGCAEFANAFPEAKGEDPDGTAVTVWFATDGNCTKKDGRVVAAE
jgi:uncharacterized membrane protein YeiB